MRNHRLALVCFYGASILAAAPAQAQTPMPEPMPLGQIEQAASVALASTAVQNGQLNETQTNIVRRVNNWFNTMLVLSANFTQTAPSGAQSQGQVFMAKPGRIRFQYARPSPLEIIADGRSVAIRDRALNTQDVYPLSQTPLRFLLQPNLDLSRDTRLTYVGEQSGIIAITLEDDNPISGKARLSLVLEGEPLMLKQWTITDSQGLDTTITLADIDTTKKPENKLFTIDYTRDIANGNR